MEPNEIFILTKVFKMIMSQKEKNTLRTWILCSICFSSPFCANEKKIFLFISCCVYTLDFLALLSFRFAGIVFLFESSSKASTCAKGKKSKKKEGSQVLEDVLWCFGNCVRLERMPTCAKQWMKTDLIALCFL